MVDYPSTTLDLHDALPIFIGSVNLNPKKKGSKLFGSVDMRQGLELEHHENSFNFSFYGLQPGNPTASLMYSYKLEGFDAGWSAPTTQTEVTYANLPPGNYNFLVRAGTKNGNWSPVTSVGIDISAPWWLSTPAYVLYALLLLLILAIPFLMFRMNRKRRNKEEVSSINNTVNQETGTSINMLLASLEDLSEEGEQHYKQRLKNIIGRIRQLLEPVFMLQPKRIQDPKIERIVLRDYMNALVHDLSPVLKDKNLEIIVNDQWNLEYFYYDVKYLN